MSIFENQADFMTLAGQTVTKSVLDETEARLAWKAVHESNLQKLEGKIEKRANGKILKSVEYKEQAKHEFMEKLK